MAGSKTSGSKKGVIKRRKTHVKSAPWQSTFRLHKNDHSELVAKLKKEEYKTSIQTFIEALVYAYLDNDERVLDIIAAHASTVSVKRKEIDWSRRESDRLLDDIESVLEEISNA